MNIFTITYFEPRVVRWNVYPGTADTVASPLSNFNGSVLGEFLDVRDAWRIVKFLYPRTSSSNELNSAVLC